MRRDQVPASGALNAPTLPRPGPCRTLYGTRDARAREGRELSSQFHSFLPQIREPQLFGGW